MISAKAEVSGRLTLLTDFSAAAVRTFKEEGSAFSVEGIEWELRSVCSRLRKISSSFVDLNSQSYVLQEKVSTSHAHFHKIEVARSDEIVEGAKLSHGLPVWPVCICC